MVSKFKTGDYWLMDNGVVIEIIDDNYNLPFIFVKRLNYGEIIKRNQNVLERSVTKYLGRNAKAVQVLLGSNIRGAYV